ncbi:hypothetical protein QFC21_002191 [Naganishia friedmannii]|uniref:Uncharacterized protein n=1 Tax=Naganishia friedmannii TaxID=89922 RepID=A0ACC2VXA1_9TREE|nr:hypothetical protein QFC21_002191 [Naganishia friedmannii]
MISGESKSLNAAAEAYRRRRGRHPPPGFDLWYKYASDHDALIVEDFFDQIYHDLEPFWGADPAVLRKHATSLLNADGSDGISIRNHAISWKSDHFWFVRWANMVNTIVHLLPDMDIPLNAEDVPRVMVSWENVTALLEKAAPIAGFTPASQIISEFQSLPPPELYSDSDIPWQLGYRPKIDSSYAIPHLYQGYVSNYTLSTDLCHQPDLQGLEGIFIQPYLVRSTDVLVPVFGGSKLSVNNDILIPSPLYYEGTDDFLGGAGAESSWETKSDKVMWRGTASGGKNTVENWRGFQRHRFLAMNNATALTRLETSEDRPENFALPEKQYNIEAQADRRLGKWVGEWSDMSTMDLVCSSPQQDKRCEYTDAYFQLDTERLSMSEQLSRAKYVPDIDGTSYSGRYLAFLRSTSLPIKAALWREWHDSRLVAWKHFIPMDHRFVDYFGIIEYFLGYEGRGGHDQAAKSIAYNGKEWAEKVLRKEDMQIYTLRLLLEYARLMDDRRERMGWINDLKRN